MLHRHTAVLIDLDGTLVETEELHLAVHREVLARHGLELNDADVAQSVGTNDDHRFYRRLAQSQGLSFSTDQIDAMVAEKDAVTHERFASMQIPVRSGGEELLQELQRRSLQFGLVTSTRRRLADIVLAQAGLTGHFAWTVCYEDTEAHKPDPAPYRLALARLGHPAEGVLVFEDSIPGVTAAHAAGCTVVACTGLTPVEQLRAAGAEGQLDCFATWLGAQP